MRRAVFIHRWEEGIYWWGNIIMVKPKNMCSLYVKIVYAHQVPSPQKRGNVVIFLMMMLAGSLTYMLDPPFLQWLQYWLPWVAYPLLLLPKFLYFQTDSYPGNVSWYNYNNHDSKMILLVLNTWNSGRIFYLTNNVMPVRFTLYFLPTF